MYHNIVSDGTTLEYHVSNNRDEAADCKSMSQRIHLDHPTMTPQRVARAVDAWMDEIAIHKSELARRI